MHFLSSSDSVTTTITLSILLPISGRTSSSLASTPYFTVYSTLTHHTSTLDSATSTGPSASNQIFRPSSFTTASSSTPTPLVTGYSSGPSGPSKTPIATGIVGGVVGFTILLLLFWLCWRRNRRKSALPTRADENEKCITDIPDSHSITDSRGNRENALPVVGGNPNSLDRQQETNNDLESDYEEYEPRRTFEKDGFERPPDQEHPAYSKQVFQIPHGSDAHPVNYSRAFPLYFPDFAKRGPWTYETSYVEIPQPQLIPRALKLKPKMAELDSNSFPADLIAPISPGPSALKLSHNLSMVGEERGHIMSWTTYDTFNPGSSDGVGSVGREECSPIDRSRWSGSSKIPLSLSGWDR